MKSNTLNIIQKIFILISTFLNITYSHTKTYQYTNTIKIYSTFQMTNILTNTITFQGKVILKYQNINVQAEKIIINYIQHNKCNPKTIKAYGNPVILHHTKNLNKIISIQSSMIYYDVNNNIITLMGNACIKQAKNSIYSDKIIYVIKDKTITAISKKNNQVLTTLFITNFSKK